MNNIETLLLSSEDELFVKIGKEHGMNLIPIDYKKKGKELYEKNLSIVRENICGNEKIKGAFLRNESDDVLLATLLSDLITGVVIGVSPATFSVLLVKKGVGNLCVEFWKNDD